MNFIDIRRGTVVLILAPTGVLPLTARTASDRQRLPGFLAQLPQDKTAMAVLRAGWSTILPIGNLAYLSDTDAVKQVTDALKARRIEAVLLRDPAVPLSPAALKQFDFANATYQRGQIVIGQKGSLPAAARQHIAPARVVQMLTAMTDADDSATILDRQASRLSAFGLGAMRGRQLRQAIVAKINQQVLDAAYIPPGPAAAAASGHASAGGAVSQMSMGEKVGAALERSLPHLSGEIRAAVAEMVTPVNLAIMAGVFVAVALANTNPVSGAAVDTILIAIAWFSAGLAGIRALGDFIDATVQAIKAESEPELDAAGQVYAKALVGMGSALIQAIMARFLSRRGGASKEPAKPAAADAADARKPPATPKDPPPPPKPALPPAVQKMPPAFQAEYAQAQAAGWKYPPGHPQAGQTWYPPNGGGISPTNTKLPANTVLDRFGGEHGSYLSAAGDSFESRALPGAPGVPNKYLVTARGASRMTVEQAEIAPWFNQPGGGTQYRIVDAATGNSVSVGDAIANGWMTRGP